MVDISGQFNHLSMKVFISGQKKFGESILRLCLNMGIEVVGISCPIGDKYLGQLAALHGLLIIPSGTLNADNFPEGVDLGITAHSFDYIGKRLRYKTKLGWIGYHPSLLPRHRGRSAIEWAIRFGDIVTGGTIFWLNSGIDRGDIAYQDWCWIDPKLRSINPKEAAYYLWRDELLPMGVRLFSTALGEIKAGVIKRVKQDARHSTFEPSADVSDIYKPDLLMLPYCGNQRPV